MVLDVLFAKHFVFPAFSETCLLTVDEKHYYEKCFEYLLTLHFLAWLHNLII